MTSRIPPTKLFNQYIFGCSRLVVRHRRTVNNDLLSNINFYNTYFFVVSQFITDTEYMKILLITGFINRILGISQLSSKYKNDTLVHFWTMKHYLVPHITIEYKTR